MDRNFNLEYNKPRVDKEYWIDTEGIIHKFKGDLEDEYVSIHYEIVYNLFPNINNPENT